LSYAAAQVLSTADCGKIQTRLSEEKKQFSHFGEANISILFNRYSISHENVYECSRLQDVATYLAATLCLGKPGSLLHLIANNSERL